MFLTLRYGPCGGGEDVIESMNAAKQSLAVDLEARLSPWAAPSCAGAAPPTQKQYLVNMPVLSGTAEVNQDDCAKAGLKEFLN
jgi:cell division septation protein DedD